MFKKNNALFLYAISPVHMGAGTAVALVDNPIQREIHTNHPSFAGSGIKGAVRHGYSQLGGNSDDVERLFGPPPERGGDHAGAVSFTDAQLLVFPVRSLRGSYIYAVCPQSIARANRLLALLGIDVNWTVDQPGEGECIVANEGLLTEVNEQKKLCLEAFEYVAKIDPNLTILAGDVANMALPDQPEHDYFRNKITRDLVVLNDTDFGYFSEFSTQVEPHVRIDEETGTAKDGGLFFTENLPPESVLLASTLASATRTGNSEEALSAGSVLALVGNLLNGALLQVGGNATIGRGLVMAKVVGG